MADPSFDEYTGPNDVASMEKWMHDRLYKNPVEQQPSGAIKESNSGKGRYDLLPPVALQRVAARFELGLLKYGDDNWTKGIVFSRFVDSAMRHLNQFRLGETDEDHLAAAVAQLMMLMGTEALLLRGELPATLNDLELCHESGTNPSSR